MLKPTDIEDLKGNHSRYAVVIGVAKRAREISEQAQENEDALVEKTVSMAINDFKSGECYLLAPNENEESQR